jgi:hypothetical protein
MNIKHPPWRGEKMKKQTYAIGYTPQSLVKSLTVTYKLMSIPKARHESLKR